MSSQLDISKNKLQYRGVHLDFARHFIHFEKVMEILKIMKELKMNIIHLHLSDDQGWAAELKCYPKIKTEEYLTIE